ncbi:hypothetical protein L914_15608, partial [Phytophthora nicotianae]
TEGIEHLPETTDAVVQEVPEDDEDSTEEPIMEIPNESTENAAIATTHVPDIIGAVPLDEFDSDNFLDALRRDHIFAPGERDDLNTGEEDWLLSLNSDAEGDEESILFDEDGDDQGKSNGEEVYDSEADDADVNNDDEVPLDLDLTEEELDRLQADEWDVFLDCDSHQVQLDPTPLYDGPSGPTRAALAYATNPLAIFYFFLPKELWRKIAEETNNLLACVDEIAQAMRARASQRREAVPSTMVYTVEEYKTKLKRKNAIQPHEIIRFIGVLIVAGASTRKPQSTLDHEGGGSAVKRH